MTPNAGEDVKQQELTSIAGGMKNDTSYLEGSLVVSYKSKHTLTIQSSNSILWYLPKGVENLYPHKNLHMMFIAS